MNKKTSHQIMALILSAAMVSASALPVFAEEASGDTYTYVYPVLDSSPTWNMHDAEEVETITQFTELDLWDLALNEEGDGYQWIPEMAVGEPEDVTAEYAGNETYGVPADATEGYAWRVTLNPDAKWEDGTPINADSYLYSVQQLLNPEMNNLNASSLYRDLPLANGENYAKAGQGPVKEPVVDIDTDEFADYGDAALSVSLTKPSSAFWGYSGADYYPGSEDLYVNEAGEDLMEKYGQEDYIPVTDEVIADINYFLASFWGEEDVAEDNYLYLAFYDKEIPETSFDEVGCIKTGEYELTLVLSIPLTPYYFKYNAENLYLVNAEKYEAGKTQSGDMIKTNYGTSVDTYMSYGPYKLVTYQADKECTFTRNENWYGWTDGNHEGMYQATDIVEKVVKDSSTQELLFLQGEIDELSLGAENLDKYQGSDYIVYYPESYVYYFNINNERELLEEREEENVNKTILLYDDFRKGLSLSIDRMEFVAMQGNGKPLYGYISDYFVYDVDNAYRYRDSEEAQEALKEFYGVSDVEEITGYDLDTARECLVAGYEQALADGEVSETDTFVFDYPTRTNETSDTRQVNFVQQSIDAAIEGTALEGRITINMMVSENFYDVLDAGEYDLCISAWNGDASDPYHLMQYFVTDEVSPQAYFGFDAESEQLEIEINGEPETHTYHEWYELLCNGKYSVLDSESKNKILSGMELGLLKKYRDCPLYSASDPTLLSMKIAYPTYDPVFEVKLGGIRFMTFNYSDAEWKQFCKENNNQLNYQ